MTHVIKIFLLLLANSNSHFPAKLWCTPRSKYSIGLSYTMQRVIKFWCRWMMMIDVSAGNFDQHLRVMTTRTNISHFCINIMSAINMSPATVYPLERKDIGYTRRTCSESDRETCRNNFLSSWKSSLKSSNRRSPQAPRLHKCIPARYSTCSDTVSIVNAVYLRSDKPSVTRLPYYYHHLL